MSFIEIEINGRGDMLVVEYKYYYEPSVHTLSNGDPGYPESHELDIISYNKDEKDYKPVLNRFDKIYPKIEIYTAIDDYIYENMDDDDEVFYDEDEDGYEYDPESELDFPMHYDGT